MRKQRGAAAGHVLFIAGFGLLPIWLVVLLGILSGSSAFGNAVPWLLMFAIPLCGLTLSIVGVTYLVRKLTKDDDRKFRNAAVAFIVSTVLGAAQVYFGWQGFMTQKRDRAADDRAAEQYLQESSEFKSRYPLGGHIALNKTEMWQEEETYNSFFTFKGVGSNTSEFYGFLRRVGDRGQRRFSVICVVRADEATGSTPSKWCPGLR